MGDDAVWVVAFASLFVAVHLAPDLRPARWALPGIAREWRKGAGVQTPSEGDPSFDVIDREFRLRRTSALAALVVLVACLPWLADLGWARRPIGVLLPFAIVLVAQLATRVVLAGGEALRERADVVLPVVPPVERPGTYLTWEGRPRPFPRVLTSTGMPDHRVLDTLAAEMGVAPRSCVVIEDSRSGVEAARAAGMRSLGFCGGLTPAEWLEGPDTVVFDDMAALADLLDASR